VQRQLWLSLLSSTEQKPQLLLPILQNQGGSARPGILRPARGRRLTPVIPVTREDRSWRRAGEIVPETPSHELEVWLEQWSACFATGKPQFLQKKKNSLIQNVNRTEVKKPGLEWAQMTPQ
jgi:hypothetical protein